jgi:hypothetical protein
VADPASDRISGLESPAENAVDITAADSDLATSIRGLYVGTGGSVKVTTVGETTATFAGVPGGSVLPVRCRRVWTTGTTASGFVGLY